MQIRALSSALKQTNKYKIESFKWTGPNGTKLRTFFRTSVSFIYPLSYSRNTGTMRLSGAVHLKTIPCTK